MSLRDQVNHLAVGRERERECQVPAFLHVGMEASHIMIAPNLIGRNEPYDLI